MKKVISAEIGPYPRPMPEGMWDPMPRVKVMYDDGTVEALFQFYPDEIQFAESEFIGLTPDQAHELKFRKDKEYLQS